MFGIMGFECFEGENEVAWFDTMDEVMEFLAMFEIFDLNELTQLTDNLWQMEG